MEESILTAVFLPLALAFIMVGMGLSLTPGDFRRVVAYPKAVTIGIICQLILLPLVGFLLVSLFQLQGALAVGLMIIAACPGGATSNLIAHLSRGDTALSISLTAVSSTMAVVTIPLIVNFSIGYFGEEGSVMLPVVKTIAQIFVITLIPVATGMVIRKKRPGLADAADKPVRWMSAVFLALIIVAAMIKERENLVAFFRLMGPATLALNLGMLLVGYLLATVFMLSKKQRITISVESGIQNGTLGIFVAATLLKNSVMTIPSAIYSLIMFMTAVLVIGLSSKLNPKSGG